MIEDFPFEIIFDLTFNRMSSFSRMITRFECPPEILDWIQDRQLVSDYFIGNPEMVFENNEGRIRRIFHFKKERDAVLFKLTWC